MMYIEWCKHESQMKIIEDCSTWYAEVTNIVRNEINGWRPNPEKPPADEVVYAITKDNYRTDVPVMPRGFPVGRWNITTVEPRHDAYRSPFIILTDAFQELVEWELDTDGGYLRPTQNKILDYQYGAHYSKYNTTQGCIKFVEIEDLLRAVQSVQREKAMFRNPILEVVA